MQQDLESSLISVIIPMYNAALYIEETINSVVSQTYTNWECIVVDDGSVDDSADIVQRMAEKDDRIIYIYQDNAGPSAARNHGFGEAKGEYIQFLDADDVLLPERFAVMLERFQDQPNSVLFSGYHVIDGKGEIKRSVSFDKPIHLDYNGMYGIYGTSILFPPACALFPKKSLEGIFWNEKMCYSEDWDLYLRVVRQNNVEFISVDSVLCCYRNTDNSLSKALFEVYKADFQILKQYYDKRCFFLFCRAYARLRFRNIIMNRKWQHGIIYFSLSDITVFQKIVVVVLVLIYFVQLYTERLWVKIWEVFK